jgi:transcriptional regulator with XRE-family HTH domain
MALLYLAGKVGPGMCDGEIFRAIGQRLRARRRLLGLTQRAVADGCGLTFQQIQKYETGQVTLSVARLIALAEVLEAPVGELLCGISTRQAAAKEIKNADWLSL